MLGSTALCTRSSARGVTVSVLAISLEAEEGTDLGVEVDVTDREAQQKFKEDFGRLPTVEKVDIASVDAQDKIEAALAGCSSVISCLGNRWAPLPRFHRQHPARRHPETP